VSTLDNQIPLWRRRFSKLTTFSVLFLIFAGGMVTSTGSGLSVPDWPLSYGMIFPPMVGGVFYEHGHRMVASVVGLFMLILAVWLGFTEQRAWVRKLGYAALGAVIAQGVLGGLTVLFFLPKPISIGHAILAQTFFTLTIIIAYSQSLERQQREAAPQSVPAPVARFCLIVACFIYCQLILGALMRHTGSGLAIYDFPTFAGSFIPRFNDHTLTTINYWRFYHGMPAVTMGQVIIHFLHRMGALMVATAVFLANIVIFNSARDHAKLVQTILLLDGFVLLQIMLGAITIWTGKAPVITSLHVVTGAACLGLSVLMTLRAMPLKLKNQ
jgi:cytochrome c oxidase assembly protein subunit 15